MQPLKLWDAWPWLILPLCFAVSIVYKAVRVEDVRRIPAEAFRATLWIVGGMGAIAVALWLIVRWLSY